MKILKRRTLPVLIATLVIGIALFIVLVGTPMDDEGRVENLEIPKGTSLSQISKMLGDARLIRSSLAFIILARVKGVSGRIKAGEYEFSSSMPATVILDKLVRGEVVGHVVVVPEGFTMSQIADAIVEAKVPKGKNFLSAATDHELLSSLGIPGRSAEGYLFPETYNLTRSMSEKEILTLMVNEFRRRVTPEIVEEAREAGLDLHELITLASLIEKEAKIKEEKPLVSAVFHNRLKMKMRLQCDPTAVYGVKDYNGVILKSHLRSRKNPYNTYVIYGLPPGPIANPGLDSIMAAINPAPVNYLYFVSRNDGSHQFSSTLALHNAGVRKFRLTQGKE
jgi:UPF0755 protein